MQNGNKSGGTRLLMLIFQNISLSP